MSKKFKNNVGANQRPLIRDKSQDYKPPAEPPNLAAKFMRENPKGTLVDEDTPAMTLAGDPVSAVTPAPAADPASPPAADAVAAPAAPQATEADAAAALAAAEPPKPAADAAGGSGDVPPVAAAAVTEPAQ